jgi:hypothetical protein
VNKIDPRELRASRNSFEVRQSNGLDLSEHDWTEDGIDYKTFFRKSFRNKKLIFLTFIFLYPILILIYYQRGIWFEKQGTVFVNGSRNSTFMKLLDQSFSTKSNPEDLDAVSSKALQALSSDSFYDFCYQSALNNPELAKVFRLKLGKGDSSKVASSSYSEISKFFNSNVTFTPFDKKAHTDGFNFLMKDFDATILDSYVKNVPPLIKNYLTSLDDVNTESARKLLKSKVETLQSKIDESNRTKMNIYNSIPLVDRASLHNLQSQLQATKITISGNKALEDQFKEGLANIEKKISSIGDMGGAEVDSEALSRELTALANQKSELQTQGLEKESFLYKNIVSNINKTLKDLEESQKKSAVSLQKNDSLSSDQKIKDLEKALEDMSVFLSKKVDKQVLASALDKTFNINFPEKDDQSIEQSPASAPTLSPEVVSSLAETLGLVKKSVEGNIVFQDKLREKIASLQKTLDLLSASKRERSDVSGYLQDISNMNYLKNQLKLQGVDEDSVIVRRISENLKKASKELQEKKNFSLKNLQIDDLYTQNFDESSLYQQQVSLEKIKAENNFYQAKITEINKAIDDLGFLLNDKSEKENQVFEIENSLKIDRSNLELLNNSLQKMDIQDLALDSRYEFTYKLTEEKSTLTFPVVILLSFFLSFMVGLCISYLKENVYPTLNTIESFEDLGFSVLGSVSQNQSPLFQENNLLNGVMDDNYQKIAINLENVLNSEGAKVVLLTSPDSSLKSAFVTLNLGTFYGSTGKKVLVIETDVTNNSISKITGAPLSGGINDLYLHKEKVELFPYRLTEGVDVLTGDSAALPPVYRLASKGFKDFLDKINVQYDYVFLHVRPCLESVEALDLTRYADLGIVCCDTKSINNTKLDRLRSEVKRFLSKKTFFILENVMDREVRPIVEAKIDSKDEQQKVAV